MYIDHAREPAAYECDFQFFHGSNLIVRPITSPGPEQVIKVWLPPSAHGWVDWNSSSMVAATATGAAFTASVKATLSTLPLFVRAGVALPLLPLDTLSVLRKDAVVWALFPGSE